MPKKLEVVPPTSDEDGEQPIPTAWRSSLAAIVHAFVQGDFKLTHRIENVDIDPESALQASEYIADYGETLVDLPDATWDTSVCQWYEDNFWHALVDLWTLESGGSDLVLHVEVTLLDGYSIKIYRVYVP